MNDMLWVAVPAGFGPDGAARLRLLVVPRLDPGPIAAAGLGQWPPPELVSATLAVGFAASAADPVTVVEVAPPHVTAQPGLWESFFPAGTDAATVRPPDPARAPKPVDTEPTTARAEAIDATFTDVAGTPVTVADRTALDDTVRTRLESWQQGPGATPAGPGGPQAVEPDFHTTVSLLREHPAVLAALGLVVELRIPALPAGLTGGGLVEVRWPGAPTTLPEIRSPWTRYGATFRPASTPTVSDGMVTLTPDGPPGPTPWSVVTVDVTRGARLLDVAAAELDGRLQDGEAAPRVAMPALRTAGLQLVRADRGTEFTRRAETGARNAALSTMDDAELDADDLVLGYRIDVRPRGGDWFSLQQRTAGYSVGGTTITTPPVEEGHVKPNAAIDDGGPTLRADEIVARWDGWSLAVGRPAFAGAPPVANRATGLQFDFDVPAGTLPRLRFPQRYALRARVADMTGDGLGLRDPAADRCATTEIAFGRYEPVPPPAVELPEGADPVRLAPGESALEVVLRSDKDVTPEAFAAAHPEYTAVLTRTLRPPHSSPTLAEYHGALDTLSDADAFALVRGTANGEQLPDAAGGGVAAFVVPEPGGIAAPLASRDWPAGWPRYGTKGVALAPRTGAGLPVAWDADTLAVRLAPAQQVTVELSTYVRTGFLDHFAAKALLPVGPSGQGTAEAVDSGRHPLLTPSVPVRFVHAVRRPLRDPAGAVTPVRDPGSTFARLDPTVARFDVDPDSTIRLDLTAAWSEHVDDEVRPVTGAPVDSSPVARGAAEPAEPLIHELGDTRHRMITYTATAASRFRQYFAADEDPAAFVAVTPLAPVSVPSTARPVAPRVLSVRPAFTWSEEVQGTRTVRRRGSRTLRVELARPWFDSGEGEQLAVVVAPTSAPEQRLWPSVTQFGRDPIRQTRDLHRFPGAAAFPRAAGAPAEVLLEDGVTSVVAVPHAVWFDGTSWLCDIEITEDALAESYGPFVQLAVARYQRESLPGLELSRVVRCDLVTVLPDRQLTVDRAGAAVTVALSGVGPGGPAGNRVDALLERFDGPTPTPDAPMAEAPNADGVPTWQPAGSSAAGPPGVPLTLTVPGPGTFRVRVMETELVDEVDPGTPADTADQLRRRVVYADVVGV